jgi:hypothetical protein
MTALHFWFNLPSYIPYFATAAAVSYCLRLGALLFMTMSRTGSEEFWVSLGSYITISALAAVLLGGERTRDGTDAWEIPLPSFLGVHTYPDDRTGRVMYHLKHDAAALVLVLAFASIPGWIADRNRNKK